MLTKKKKEKKKKIEINIQAVSMQYKQEKKKKKNQWFLNIFQLNHLTHGKVKLNILLNQ